MNFKLEQLQRQLEHPEKGDWEIDKFVDKISQIKELASVVGSEKKENTPLDYIKTLGENFGPALTQLLVAKNKQHTPQPQSVGVSRFSEKTSDDYGEEEEEMTDEEVIQIHQRENQSMRNQNIKPQQQRKTYEPKQQIPQTPVNKTTYNYGGYFKEPTHLKKVVIPKTNDLEGVQDYIG